MSSLSARRSTPVYVTWLSSLILTATRSCCTAATRPDEDGHGRGLTFSRTDTAPCRCQRPRTSTGASPTLRVSTLTRSDTPGVRPPDRTDRDGVAARARDFRDSVRQRGRNRDPRGARRCRLRSASGRREAARASSWARTTSSVPRMRPSGSTGCSYTSRRASCSSGRSTSGSRARRRGARSSGDSSWLPRSRAASRWSRSTSPTRPRSRRT